MQLIRIFSTEKAKGSRNYLDSQKKYELIRTLIYFLIPVILFLAGIIQTQSTLTGMKGNGWELLKAGLANPKSRVNLLSIVAVLGLLPASKSLVSTIMFLRFHSFTGQEADQAAAAGEGLAVLFDCVFTSYKKSFVIRHLAVRGNTVCGYAGGTDFAENQFYQHIGEILKADGHKDTSVKVFTDFRKYTERLRQMASLEDNETQTRSVIATLKSVML